MDAELAGQIEGLRSTLVGPDLAAFESDLLDASQGEGDRRLRSVVRSWCSVRGLLADPVARSTIEHRAAWMGETIGS